MEKVKILQFLLRILVGIAEDDGVTPASGHRLQTIHGLRVKQIGDIGDHQADYVAPAGFQALRESVGVIIELAHHLFDPSLRFRANRALLVKHSGDGGHGNAS